MKVIDHPSRQPAPPAAISRVLATFGRDQLAGFIEVAIGLLDLADGDADLEANGDELDGSLAEDDFADHSAYMPGPGCPISDPDVGVDDQGEAIDEREPEHDTIPLYGMDQSEGPINQREVLRAHLRAECVEVRT